MGGSGGSAGKIDFPEHMKTHHITWLGQLDGMVVSPANPYSGDTFDDPSGDMGSNWPVPATVTSDLVAATFARTINTEHHAEYDTIKADWETDWPTDPPTAEIADMVEAAGEKLQNAIDKAVGRYEQEAINAGGVLSSAFVMARHSLQDQLLDAQADMTKSAIAQAALQTQKLKYDRAVHAHNIAGTIVGNQTQADQVEMNHLRNAAHYTIDGVRIYFAAQVENTKLTHEADAKAYEYEFNVYMWAGQVLGAINGAATMIPNEGSQIGNMLGGALSGAAQGAMVGGAPGAAIGGVGGAIAGML